MTDIRQAESAANYSIARFEQWKEKWMAKFFRPLAEDAFRQMLMKLTPEQHMMLRAQDPDGYDKTMKMLGMGGE